MYIRLGKTPYLDGYDRFWDLGRASPSPFAESESSTMADQIESVVPQKPHTYESCTKCSTWLPSRLDYWQGLVAFVCRCRKGWPHLFFM